MLFDLLAQAAPAVNDIVIQQGTLDLPDLPSSLELSARIVLAAGLAAAIGLERELSDHPSGLRTHISVAIGACLFGLASAYAFTEFIALRSDNNYQVDVTRVASQVVAGIGFLGGGAIIKQGNTVRGLTSAAGLWVSAAVGLAVSLGMYVESSVATLTLVAALVLLRAPRRWLRNKAMTGHENVTITMPLGADTTPVITFLQNLPGSYVHSIVVKPRPSENVVLVEADVESKGGMIATKVSPLEERDDVLTVEVS
jgi:putative Mg2+ transporter-C (MgtC) family protein